MKKLTVTIIVILTIEASSAIWLLARIYPAPGPPEKAAPGPPAKAAPGPPTKAAPGLQSTNPGLRSQANVPPPNFVQTAMVRNALIQSVSGNTPQLNANGTVSVTNAQVAMFEHADLHLWASAVEVLHFAGSVSLQLNYGDVLSRFVAEKTLPGLQEMASQICAATSVSKWDSVELYKSLELVTLLGKTVIIETPDGEYMGIFKGARMIVRTSTQRVYLVRISEEFWEYEIQLNLSDLTNGIITVRGGDKSKG
ncbi:hypothetical protein EJ07DRAFT_159284 [Lizonia empirigonia]|nr:hypothetical protein EJ07DRAFT_159284 [Lizonia empirigonia]